VMNSVGTRNSAEPMTIYSMHPMTSCGGEGGGGGGVWGGGFLDFVVPNVFSPNSHFFPQIKFLVGSQHVLQALKVFPNMVTIAPHFVPYGFAQQFVFLDIVGWILGLICLYVWSEYFYGLGASKY
jgi:hypothetical protein